MTIWLWTKDSVDLLVNRIVQCGLGDIGGKLFHYIKLLTLKLSVNPGLTKTFI